MIHHSQTPSLIFKKQKNLKYLATGFQSFDLYKTIESETGGMAFYTENNNTYA